MQGIFFFCEQTLQTQLRMETVTALCIEIYCIHANNTVYNRTFAKSSAIMITIVF